mmetsp:Transcript_56970/g.123847  ORF Transcript_56970/g.123847 Transcript_56970/m.123847 type:complete len:237 (+) Transcript_56970:477-1187(+)
MSEIISASRRIRSMVASSARSSDNWKMDEQDIRRQIWKPSRGATTRKQQDDSDGDGRRPRTVHVPSRRRRLPHLSLSSSPQSDSAAVMAQAGTPDGGHGGSTVRGGLRGLSESMPCSPALTPSQSPMAAQANSKHWQRFVGGSESRSPLPRTQSVMSMKEADSKRLGEMALDSATDRFGPLNLAEWRGVVAGRDWTAAARPGTADLPVQNYGGDDQLSPLASSRNASRVWQPTPGH